MFQNNFQGISRNLKEKFKFHSSGYYKILKWKMAVQTCNQQTYAIYDFKSRICPQRGRKM